MDSIFQRVYDLIAYAAYVMAKDIIDKEVESLVQKELSKRLLEDEIDEIKHPKKNSEKLAQ